MKHAIVYLLCGLPGSGKTTYAKNIVNEQGALSLSIDDEMINRYGVAGRDYPIEKRNEYKASVMKIIKSEIVKNIKNGQSVVLDFAVWKKRDREYFRNLVESNGAEMQLIYLKASRALLLERLNSRAEIEKGKNFIITPDLLDERIAIFEEPNNENEEVISQDQ
jgi:predicted kinase